MKLSKSLLIIASSLMVCAYVAPAHASEVKKATQPKPSKFTSLLNIEKTNALAVFNALDSGSSAAMMAARVFTVPNSPASTYLAMRAEITDYSLWANYLSKNLALPNPKVGTVTLAGPKANPASAVLWSPLNSPPQKHLISFSSSGLLNTWDIQGLPTLGSRIWTVNGAGSAGGTLVNVEHIYVSNDGYPIVTAKVQNTGTKGIVIVPPRSYVGADGVGHNMTATWICVLPGQTAQIALTSDSKGSGGSSGKISMAVAGVGADGTCASTVHSPGDPTLQVQFS